MERAALGLAPAPVRPLQQRQPAPAGFGGADAPCPDRRNAVPTLLAGIGWKKGMAYRDSGANYVEGKPGGDPEGEVVILPPLHFLLFSFFFGFAFFPFWDFLPLTLDE